MSGLGTAVAIASSGMTSIIYIYMYLFQAFPCDHVTL